MPETFSGRLYISSKLTVTKYGLTVEPHQRPPLSLIQVVAGVFTDWLSPNISQGSSLLGSGGELSGGEWELTDGGSC